jgi:CRISPR/Cas system-associated protein Csx1
MNYINIAMVDNRDVVVSPSPLRQMEHNATTLKITLPEGFLGYSYKLVLQLNGNTPIVSASLTEVDNTLEFLVPNVLTYQAGILRCEVHAYDENILLKSGIYAVEVIKSIQGEPTTPPTL